MENKITKLKDGEYMTLIQVFIRLMKLMGKRLYLYLTAILIMTISSAGFTVLGSYILKNIIEAAQTKNTNGLITKIILIFVLGIILLYISKRFTIIYNVEAKRGYTNLDKIVFEKSIKLPISYYENNHSGDFMSKLMFDKNQSGEVYGSRLRRFVAPIIIVLVYIIPMFILGWQITLGMLLVNIITFFINRILLHPMKKVGTQLSICNGALTENLTNIISGIDLLKIFSINQILKEKYNKTNHDYIKIRKKHGRLSALLESLNQGFGLINDLILLLLGIYFVGNGTTSISNLAALYALKGAIVWQFLQIGRYLPELANCLASAQRLFEFLDIEEEPKLLDYGKSDINNYIFFDKVNFSYNKSKKIIHDFSLSIEKGKIIALTGESGKGKSTIAKLLLGFYPIDSGNIIINSKNFREYNLNEIRDMISYIPQEPYLYQVSIAENISYGNSKATIGEIIEAAKAAHAHDFINNFDKGYNTIVGERGNKLSGGEKQRIAIARAILKNSPILLMDEATSALDNESENLVSEALNKLMEGRTTIMIAHRPSTISRADIVVNL
jgi:ATP-binding cassette subfamily B protein